MAVLGLIAPNSSSGEPSDHRTIGAVMLSKYGTNLSLRLRRRGPVLVASTVGAEEQRSREAGA